MERFSEKDPAHDGLASSCPASDVLDVSSPRVAGRWVVIGMFGFGTVLMVLLALYWHFHTAPFRPLQNALAAEFPGSLPRVEGGQHKKHRDTPKILRIALRTDFDPTAASVRRRVAAMVRRIVGLAARHVPLAQYDRLEIYLYFRRPEQASVYRAFRFRIADLPDDAERLSDTAIESADVTAESHPASQAP